MQDTTTTLDPNAAHALALLGPVFFIMVLFFLALYIIPLWQIVKKAGFHPALSLLILVPVVNIVMLYVFAFSRWRVVPAPEYTAGYAPQVPQVGTSAYAPVYGQGTVPMTPAANNYSAPGAYVPSAPQSSQTYPPPPTEPPTHL